VAGERLARWLLMAHDGVMEMNCRLPMSSSAWCLRRH